MYIYVNFNMFCDMFTKYGRQDQFSYEGKKALFDYFEQLEDDTNEKIELDVIAICCDWTEYDSFEELKTEYSDIEDLDDLKDKTTVLEFNNGSLIIQAF